MYKEYYKDKLPMHLQHLVPNEPLGITEHAKIMFQQCTKYAIIYEDSPFMLYYVTMLIFRY